jgi:hypothetical protein
MQNVIYLDDDLTPEELREIVEEQRIARKLGISDERATIVDNRDMVDHAAVDYWVKAHTLKSEFS